MSQTRELPMQRPGHEGEKAKHYHKWALTEWTGRWLWFECERCKETFTIEKESRGIKLAMGAWP